VVICDTCKLKDAGCTVKKLVLARGETSCGFYAVQIMEKVASTEESTVSWTSGDGQLITQITKDGQVLNQTIS